VRSIEAFALGAHAHFIHLFQVINDFIEGILKNERKDKILSFGRIFRVIHGPHIERTNVRFRLQYMSNALLFGQSHRAGGHGP
jgi:hypothetical protein